MSYQFIDAYGSVLTADSSIISGVKQRPILDIGSILSAFPVNFVGGSSVSGTVGASIIGLAPVNVVGSVYGTMTLAGNPSISGTVNIGTIPGSVVAFQGTTPWVIGSVYGNISGSVVATITNTNINVSGSVISFPASTTPGSVIAFQGTSPWIIGSIVGTYAEDAAHTSADKGIFVLGVRNDTVSSFTSADLEYIPLGTDSAGRTLMKPFAGEESRLDTATSVVSGSVTALFNSVLGLRNYVTDIMVANTGSVATLITFQDGSTSILGYTIAPAGGGSNAVGFAMPMRTAPGQDFAFKAGTSTSILYMTAKGYKAP